MERCEFCQFEQDPGSGTGGYCPRCGLKDAGKYKNRICGPCWIFAEIGRGANGIVFLAKRLRTGAEAALKLLPSEKASDPGILKNFLREAELMQQVDCPYTIHGEDAGSLPDGSQFLVMEYFRGRTVEERILSEGPLPLADTLMTALQTAKALQMVWENYQLSHGDVKPANLLIDDQRRVKVTDFGLAAFQQEQRTGDVMATPAYAPPEVISDVPSYNRHKADMYSFGATLYEMLTGRPPFEGPAQEVLLHHLNDLPVPPYKKMPLCDRRLSDLTMQLLQKDPDKRPQTFAQITRKLEQIQQGLNAPERSFGKVLWPAVLLLLLAGLTFLAIQMFRIMFY